MKKRFLGLISLMYSLIIIYVVVTDRLKNFLAPNMQLYLKVAIIPLILISIVLLFTNKINYKFKISDLILLLPLIMLIIAGNGRLTTSFANNRTLNTNTKEKVNYEKRVENNNIELEKEYDFSNPYFNVTNEVYDRLSSYISYEPNASIYEGKTIKVRGFAVKYASYIPDNYFTIGRYLISCCAADATFTGFFASYDLNKIKNGSWYEIEGILAKGKDKDNYDIMYIEVINIKEIKEEEQYVYPCYAYGDGSCKEVFEYNLE